MSRMQTLEKRVLLWDPARKCLHALAEKSNMIEMIWESEQQRCVVGTFDNRANFLDMLESLQATLDDVE